MHEYFFRPEVVRIALVLSVVVSIVFYERLQLTTGGAIVPAYLATFLPTPVFVLSTILVAYVTFVLVNQIIAKRWILYGRRKFEVEILVGLVLVSVTTGASLLLTDFDPLLSGLAGVGLLIPGVLAHDMFRQRPRTTLIAVTATTAILALFLFIFASLLEISQAADDPLYLAADLDTAYPMGLLLPGVIMSVLMGLFIFDRLGIRSGGFITAAYLAMVLERPIDLLFAAGLGVLTWAVVTRLVMPRLLVFGRRKLSTMVLVGAILAWSAELSILVVTDGEVRPWEGFTLMTLMAPALLANDAQRQGLERTAWGAAIAALGVYGAMKVLEGLLVAAGWL